ncbi:MAG: hypothetical protein SVM80_10495, partial [Halobacteriota archaeon]|nr:hypothetical protein [Halobacteriota archaeon]
KSNIKPHKISSYVHQVDPGFESKSAVVLHTYKQAELLRKKFDMAHFRFWQELILEQVPFIIKSLKSTEMWNSSNF